VHILFSNEDEGIPHNISVYADPTATIPIFQGDAIDGPGSIDYLFTAPSGEGTYFFRCDFHPTQMFGAFIVKAP
jgi:plastocyanin